MLAKGIHRRISHFAKPATTDVIRDSIGAHTFHLCPELQFSDLHRCWSYIRSTDWISTKSLSLSNYLLYCDCSSPT